MTKENQVNGSSGYSRRDAIRLLLGGAAATATPGCRELTDVFKTRDNSQFELDSPVKVTRIGDNLFVEYKGRVFKVNYEKPEAGRGINHLVSKLNPTYDDAQIMEIGNLTATLIQLKSELGTLKNNRDSYEFEHAYVRIPVLSQNATYPIPKQIEAKSLNDLLANYR